MAVTGCQIIIEPCSRCGQLIDVSALAPFACVSCPACGEAMHARKRFNQFAITDSLGVGGLGMVFKAIDLSLNRPVALKVLRWQGETVREALRQLEAEARLTASINHPHVVKVFTFGEDHGQFYLAMEFMEMGSLDDLMLLKKRVPAATAMKVGLQIAQGLEAGSEVGLIHRDVKPGNILFSDTHTAKIVDFGLAILMKEEAHRRGDVWGTPYYVAPETLDGRHESCRSDMFSLGATLFHAIAGRPPFDAPTTALAALKRSRCRSVSLQAFAPEVSRETAYVVDRLLEHDPDKRFASYRDLIGHLQYALHRQIDRSRN